MTITRLNLTFCTFALASMCGYTAIADDSSQSQNRKDNQRQSQSQRDSRGNSQSGKQMQQSQDKKSQQQESQQAQSQRSSQNSDRAQVEPVGWITVASDYNHDGFYDAVETIYYYDLKEARDKSRQRSQNGGQSTGNTHQTAQRASVQGQITSLKSEKSSGSGQSRLIAKIENNEGRTVHVCLGPKNELSSLKLSQGDRVSVEGLITRKDGEQVLLATKVSANGNSVQQKLSQRSSINRVEGTLKSLREAHSKRGDGAYLVGEVSTEKGTQKVHFGPKHQLSKLQLSEGDDIQVLTTSGKVSGKQVKLAVQVTANDQTAKITRSQRQNRDSGNDKSNKNRDQSDG